MSKRITKVVTKQWSFFWAGLLFGLAQILFMLVDIQRDFQVYGRAVIDPLRVTAGLGQMFRGLEVFIFGGKTNLYGQVFQADVWWPIIGMILGGSLVGLMESEFRSWVKYNKKMLLLSFVGGIVFSYGTRLAGGCTLYHLLGGIPLMQIDSWVVVAVMSLSGMLTFFLLAKLGLAGYFKHQETRFYIEKAQLEGSAGEGLGYDSHYKPWRDPWRWLGVLFLALMVGVAVWNGLFNPAYKMGFSRAGWSYPTFTLLAGLLAGVAMAKSGFGTECATVSLELSPALRSNDGRFRHLGLPRITQTLFKGMFPFVGVITAIVITNLFMVVAWIGFGIPLGHHILIKDQLNLGHVVGAAMLGFGAVALIGCEIRSYMRLGLFYGNTLVGFIGFAIGYLPYTLYPQAHEAWLKSTIIIHQAYNWPELISGNPTIQYGVGVIYSVLLLAILFWAVRTSARVMGIPLRTVLGRNIESIQLSLDKREAFKH
ncbi:MAG: YeeE/YedE thiosulfate transporter family protein [Desulfitobacteriaceae bacterium]|nr:YeeE/YedE thiosulfate transporter family protein [Desulfitobacteriaceae bacterium]MDI6913154.1 YeeE/YedE thiosulfate transporter family protein [Desulfitobacteriaceae bacterium]